MLSCRSKKRGFQRKEQVLWRNGHLSEYNENRPWFAVHLARDKSQHQLIEERQVQGLKRGKSIWLTCFKASEKSIGLDLRNLLSRWQEKEETPQATLERRDPAMPLQPAADPAAAPAEGTSQTASQSPACCWPVRVSGRSSLARNFQAICMLLTCHLKRLRWPHKELPSPVPASTLSASLTKAT